MSTWLLLFGLGVAWAAVLAPDVLRRMSTTRRHDPMSQFSSASRNLSNVHQLNTRDRRGTIDLRPNVVQAAPRRVSPQPGRKSAQQQRRQDVLVGLVAAAVLSFLAAISMGGIAMALHFVVDIALVAYIAALASVTKRERVRGPVVGYSNPALQRGVAAAYDDRRRIAR